MLDSEHLKGLPPAAFAALGAHQIAYIKATQQGGRLVYAVFAADGTPMAIYDKQDIAQAACIQNELEPLTVH